jgi:G:T/U-mismatch repair DNA glycosylase
MTGRQDLYFIKNYSMTDGIIKSFEPIGDKRAVVLILGTMPGRESLNKSEYYAHRRNSFWHIMDELFGAGFSFEYEQRQKILVQNGTVKNLSHFFS